MVDGMELQDDIGEPGDHLVADGAVEADEAFVEGDRAINGRRDGNSGEPVVDRTG